MVKNMVGGYSLIDCTSAGPVSTPTRITQREYDRILSIISGTKKPVCRIPFPSPYSSGAVVNCTVSPDFYCFRPGEAQDQIILGFSKPYAFSSGTLNAFWQTFIVITRVKATGVITMYLRDAHYTVPETKSDDEVNEEVETKSKK